ncbi:hypothetical protein FRB94_004218 [Tulasnella sp. JGI-2019a]|nr:hypothetical protein FRB94_004218 [Tulasnella sp. JGI-2019a]KAG9030165.1 hypothetical protein FRB95_004258 [Tulasnella sp. JGI-2019a]
MAAPISSGAFRRMWESLATSNLKLKKLAVAFSGGPDSLALLFLLQRHLRLMATPIPLLSITVNHHLQAASDSMTAQCKALSHSLGVENISISIPWSQAPFPPVPVPGSAIEEIARRARAQLIFDLMQSHGCNGLVMGHHADDQVETLLMRMSRHQDSTDQRRPGFSGMRSVRRWGMGYGTHPGALGWAGVNGMDAWILRPLLSAQKESLIATCRREGLESVQDSTNFDPTVTRRNAFRAALKGQSLSPLNDVERDLTLRTIGQAETLALAHAERHDTRADLLRSFVDKLALDTITLDQEVTQLLESLRVPSPPSSLVFRHACALNQGASSATKRALVLRILRYVSPRPWGSPLAEAGRNSRSIDGIASHLFRSESTINQPHAVASFTMGGGVLWREGVLRGPELQATPISILSKDWKPEPTDELCWIAHRAPPRTYQEKATVESDITSAVVGSMDISRTSAAGGEQKLLWDCRFAITLYPWLLSPKHKQLLREGGWTVLIRPVEPFQLPEVVATNGRVTKRLAGFKRGWKVGKGTAEVTWARFAFIRALSAI